MSENVLTSVDVERLAEKLTAYKAAASAWDAQLPLPDSDVSIALSAAYEEVSAAFVGSADALLALARRSPDKAIAERDAYKAALASLSSVLLELQEAMLAGRVEMDDAARAAVAIGLDRVSEALEVGNAR